MDVRMDVFLLSVILTVKTISAQVMTPPENVTVKRGGLASFTCSVKSPDDLIMWAKYQPGIQVIYTSRGTPGPVGKYWVNGSSTLFVKDVDLSDGVPYSCMDVGLENQAYYANLVVIGDLLASVYPSDVVSFGDEVNLTCSLQYAGPTHDHLFSTLSPNQDPKISIFFGNEDLTFSSNETHWSGPAPQTIHSKTLSIKRILKPEDVQKTLKCYVSSVKPQYEDSVNLSLPFKYSPRTVTIDVGANVTNDWKVYVGTLLNCSADGIPAPRVTWIQIGKNPAYELVKSEPGYSVLKLVGPGLHQWNCSASNSPGILTQAHSEINLTVIGLPPKLEASKADSVGLGVGLGIGLGIPIIVGAVIVVYLLRKKKYSGYGKPNANRKKSPAGEKRPPPGVDSGPIFKPAQPGASVQFQPHSADHNSLPLNQNQSHEQTGDATPKPYSHSPGYADLGVKTLGSSGSMPHLNESFDSTAERSFNRDPRMRNYSSYDDDDRQYYPLRYQKAPSPNDSVV